MTAEQARQLRKLLENQTAAMTDEQILNYPDFVEKWKSGQKYDLKCCIIGQNDKI